MKTVQLKYHNSDWCYVSLYTWSHSCQACNLFGHLQASNTFLWFTVFGVFQSVITIVPH